MRIKIIAFLFITFTCTSCDRLYNKNKETLKILIISKESDKGIYVKNFTIDKHSETHNTIKVFLDITDLSNRELSDTLNFATTGDGFVEP